jgi:hypothetical protein
MKSIELKFGKEKLQGREMFFSTSDLLRVAINNVNRETGLDVKEMSSRLRLVKVLDEHPEFSIDENDFTDAHLEMKKSIDFEDADFEKLKKLFSETKWGVISQFIIDLNDEIEGN